MVALVESRLWHLIVCDRGVSLLAHQVNVLLCLDAQDKRAFSYRVSGTNEQGSVRLDAAPGDDPGYSG